VDVMTSVQATATGAGLDQEALRRDTEAMVMAGSPNLPLAVMQRIWVGPRSPTGGAIPSAKPAGTTRHVYDLTELRSSKLVFDDLLRTPRSGCCYGCSSLSGFVPSHLPSFRWRRRHPLSTSHSSGAPLAASGFCSSTRTTPNLWDS